MTPAIRILAITVLLVGCQHDSNVGSEDPDARTDAATADADPDAPAACACGPASCGARICGRSDCGYPCGLCGGNEFCFLGTECQAGPGPGTACIDAFGGPVWEGDRGHDTCAGDPTQTRLCTCTGGGPDAWASCDPCADVCPVTAATGIACGPTDDCSVGTEVCCISTQDTTDLSCSDTPCQPNNYTRACDGPEDCTGAICCGGDNLWTAACSPVTDCGGLEQLCHDTSDCPGAEAHCCPLAGTDIKTCTATLGPGCT